jgi:hypothetical protein
LEQLLAGYGLVAVIVLLLTAHYLSYVHRTSANIVFQDHINLVSKVDRYFSGQLSWSDVWILYDDSPYLIHRLPAAVLLTIANAAFWHWNTRAELFLGALWLSGLAVTLFVMFRATLADRACDLQMQLLFIPIALVVYSLTQWENFLLTIGLYLVLQSFVYALCVLAVWRSVVAPSNALILLSVTSIGAALLFVASGYSLPFGLAVLAALGQHWWRVRRDRASAWPVLVNAGAVVVCLAIYMEGLDPWSSTSQTAGQEPGSPAGMVAGLTTLAQALVTVLMTSMVSNGWLPRQPLVAQLAVGSLAIGFMVYALAVVRRVESSRSFAPVLLITFSLLLAAVICLARGERGMAYLASSRYVTQLSLGLTGAIWAVALAWTSARAEGRRSTARTIWLLFVVALLVGQGITLSDEWALSPLRKRHFERLQAMALYPEEFGEADFRSFQTSRTKAQLVERLARLAALDLNVFHDPPSAGGTLDSAILLDGWYGAEPGGRWMAEEARLLLRSGGTGIAVVVGRTPAPQVVSTLRVHVNGREAVSFRVRGEPLAHTINVPPRALVLLRMSADPALVPADAGLGPDRRRLGYFVERLESP